MRYAGEKAKRACDISGPSSADSTVRPVQIDMTTLVTGKTLLYFARRSLAADLDLAELRRAPLPEEDDDDDDDFLEVELREALRAPFFFCGRARDDFFFAGFDAPPLGTSRAAREINSLCGTMLSSVVRRDTFRPATLATFGRPKPPSGLSFTETGAKKGDRGIPLASDANSSTRGGINDFI